MEARDEIYRLFREGWSVRDLSYKYGILPQRVKAIVYCREVFWKHVFPRFGPSEIKVAYERELEYEKEFKFVDYGKDLHVMGILEQGSKVHFLNKKTRLDSTIPEEEAKVIEKTLANTRPKNYDLVPTHFVGKGPKGYLIKDMVVRRGNGAMRVSKMFKKFCKWGHSNPHILPKRVSQRTQLGPRIATMGFRHEK